MSTAQLSSADQSALAFDGPETPMHIMAILWLERGPLLGADRSFALQPIRLQIVQRLERAPRLRQVVHGSTHLFGRAVWTDASHFDIEEHVSSTRLSAPGTEEQLLELAASMFMAQFDRRRPLWELRIVEGLDDDRVAIIVKLHHAIADGPSAVRLVAALLDVVPSMEPARPAQRYAKSKSPPRSRAAAVRAALRGYANAFNQMRRAPVTSINRPVGRGRRLAIVRLSLDEARRIAHATGTTINDVFLTLASAGTAAILARRHEHIARSEIVAGVFVGLRQERSEFGNETGVMTVALPIGATDPTGVLAGLARTTAAAKARQPAAAASALTYLVTRAGLGRILYRRQRQVNIFTTNVVGPTTPLAFLGATIQDIAAVTSLGGNVGLSYAALSYAGHLNITVIGDADACPDVDTAAGAMCHAWEELRARVKQRPDSVAAP